MIKTVALTGGVQEVKFAGKHQYFHVHNLGGGEVLMSLTPGVERGKEDVLIVPSGSGGYVQNDMAAGTVYLAGSGEVQVAATGNAFSPFKSGMKGGGNVTTEGGAIAGTVDYPIIALNLYGESVQDGTPTPEMPAPIVSVGEVGVEITACGKNLLSYPYEYSNMEISGLTFAVNSDGTINVSGTSTAMATFRLYGSGSNTEVLAGVAGGKTYIMSENVSCKVIDSKGQERYVNTSVTLANDEIITYVYVQYGANVTVNATLYPMIQLAGTDDTYEPYKANSAFISSGMPLCSIGDVRDELVYNADGTGKIIKHTKLIVADGTNIAATFMSVNADSGITQWRLPYDNALANDLAICSHLGYHRSTATTNEHFFVVNDGGNTYVRCYAKSSTVGTTAAEINAWLAAQNAVGTPFTVIATLAEPQEIKLSAAEMAQLMQLQTFSGVTNIYNDEDAEMTVKVATNPLLSEYVMPVIEGITAKFEKRIAALESAITSNT